VRKRHTPTPTPRPHRYALLLFEQPGFQQIDPPAKRANFQTKEVCHSVCVCVC
jgi:hypothetical protein